MMLAWPKRGTREPTLLVLLRYARLVGTSTDVLIDDKLELMSNKRKITSSCGTMGMPVRALGARAVS